MTANLHDVCDYIISRVCNAGSSMNELKLQKLLYYAQAWHLAVFGSRLFDERFQAWVHGPVCRAIYDRFGATKSLYSSVELSDVRPEFDFKALTDEQREHIDSVLVPQLIVDGSPKQNSLFVVVFLSSFPSTCWVASLSLDRRDDRCSSIQTVWRTSH